MRFIFDMTNCRVDDQSFDYHGTFTIKVADENAIWYNADGMSGHDGATPWSTVQEAIESRFSYYGDEEDEHQEAISDWVMENPTLGKITDVELEIHRIRGDDMFDIRYKVMDGSPNDLDVVESLLERAGEAINRAAHAARQVNTGLADNIIRAGQILRDCGPMIMILREPPEPEVRYICPKCGYTYTGALERLGRFCPNSCRIPLEKRQ